MPYSWYFARIVVEHLGRRSRPGIPRPCARGSRCGRTCSKYGLTSHGSMPISLANFLATSSIGREVVGLAAHRPARVQRRQHGLLVGLRRIGGMPADRSLLSRTTHGSKLQADDGGRWPGAPAARASACRRRAGRSSVGSVMSGSSVPMRTLHARPGAGSASASRRSAGRTGCACGSPESAAGRARPGRSSRSPPSPPARTAAGSRADRLLKPPGNRLVSTGAILKPLLRRSTEQ